MPKFKIQETSKFSFHKILIKLSTTKSYLFTYLAIDLPCVASSITETFSVTLYLYFIIEFKTRWFAAILYMLKWFSGHQIRNVGVGVLTYYLKPCNGVRLPGNFADEKKNLFITISSKNATLLL